ncbi:MAG: MBL fold metallo-hydrolase [Bacteroidota bacterium]
MLITQSFQHEEILGLKFGYHPLGRPRLFVHLYYVDGLLIDTGQSNAGRSILKATEQLDIQQIFITHQHEDHTGNIAPLKAQHECPVYASASCCQIMQAPPKLSLAQKLTWGNRPAQTDLIPITGTITTPRFHFQLIPIPGHAADMLALYEPQRRWLFSADLYLNSRIDYFLKSESMAQQIASIKTVLQLDFDALLCSHRPRLTDGKAALRKKLHFLESFYHEVADLHQQGHSATDILRRLQLRENWLVRLLSGGALSKLNMVRSVIRDVERE